MSDFSLTLVLQIKTSKIINDMAKVQHKSEKISAFGGIFFVLDIFDRILSSVIDSHLGLRSKLIGYQYSEIIRAVFSVFCCGGNCMEDLNLYLKDVLTERPHTRVPSADTVLRGIEELATENISYTVEKTGNVYDFNTAEKLNQLLVKLLLATGQLKEGGEYDVDGPYYLAVLIAYQLTAKSQVGVDYRGKNTVKSVQNEKYSAKSSDFLRLYLYFCHVIDDFACLDLQQ